MKLFLSHSNQDAIWARAVKSQLEKLGISVYLAELDLQPGHFLNAKLQRNIDLADAVVVLLSESAALSPIVREEIGYALRAGKLVVPLVAPSVARSPSLLGMLNGREYILFEKDEPRQGLLALTQWAQDQVHREQEAILQRQWAEIQSVARREGDERLRAEQQLASQANELAQLRSSNDALLVLLIFAAVVAGVAIIGALSQ